MFVGGDGSSEMFFGKVPEYDVIRYRVRIYCHVPTSPGESGGAPGVELGLSCCQVLTSPVESNRTPGEWFGSELRRSE